MPLSKSEQNIVDWLLAKGIDLDEWFASDDEGKRDLAKALGRDYYMKGRTENFEKQLDKFNIWRDIAPVITERAEEQTVEPRLARVEALVGETNTRSELSRSREALGAIPKERLTGDRIQRYERIEGSLNQVENVITSLEEEIGMLGRAPAVTADESRNVNALLRQARESGITSAGGQVIGESRVRYRSEAPVRTFAVREYPASYSERTGTWSERSVFRVYRADTGEQIGSFDHRPTASEIKAKWKS